MSDMRTVRKIDLSWPLGKRQSALLLDFCFASGVDCFTANFLYCSEAERLAMETQFFDQLVPYSLGRQPLERMVVYAGDPPVAPKECWRLNGSTIELILKVCEGSLSSEQFTRYPEDWAFYRRGQLFLGFVTHEKCAFLRLFDEDLLRLNSLAFSPEA